MSKIETTIKVSLKLPRRINLGRQGARAELSTWTMPISPPSPQPRKGPKPSLTPPPADKYPDPPITTRNGKTARKHGPFDALTMRNQLYQKPFPSNVHQNLNKRKDRAIKTVCELPFYLAMSLISKNMPGSNFVKNKSFQMLWS